MNPSSLAAVIAATGDSPRPSREKLGYGASEYFPAPPEPPSEELDRFQWYNPADWFGFHEEEKYQLQNARHKFDVADRATRRQPETGRVYVLPSRGRNQRDKGRMDKYVYHAPKYLTEEERKKFPEGVYRPLAKDFNNAGKYSIDRRVPNWEVPHTTSKEGYPNTSKTWTYERHSNPPPEGWKHGEAGPTYSMEPFRTVIPTKAGDRTTKEIHKYHNLTWNFDEDESYQRVTGQKFKDMPQIEIPQRMQEDYYRRNK